VESDGRIPLVEGSASGSLATRGDFRRNVTCCEVGFGEEEDLEESCDVLFEVNRDEKVLQTIDATAKLSDFGKGAETALPDHK
jgi:hypothetical protein